MADVRATPVRLLDTRTGSIYEINLTDVQKCRVQAEPEYAEDLIAKAIRHGAQPIWAEGHGNGESTTQHSNSDGQKDYVWATKSPTQTDEEATLAFIKVMAQKDIQIKLKGKKRLRNTFEEVCSRMHAAGFVVGGNIREGGIRCQQKWRNLKRMYMNYSTYLKVAGDEVRAKPPRYYEQVEDIFGKAFSGYPSSVNLNNDTNVDPIEEDNTLDHCPDSPETSVSVNNTFEDASKASREFCELISRKIDEESMKQDVRSKRIERLLLEQNKNLNRMVGLLECLVSKGSKKRKRRAEEDETD